MNDDAGSGADSAVYRGTTTPGVVGWTRVGIVVGAALVLAVVPLLGGMTSGPALAVFALVALLSIAAWTWMGLRTTFVVDTDGVTVRLGGFWRQRTWPLSDFRGVQLRTIPAERLGATVGGVGRRAGLLLPPMPGDVTALPGRRILTPGDQRRRSRMVVSRAGTMVEIVGRGAENYLLSADDPRATAEALDALIHRGRRRP